VLSGTSIGFCNKDPWRATAVFQIFLRGDTATDVALRIFPPEDPEGEYPHYQLDLKTAQVTIHKFANLPGNLLANVATWLPTDQDIWTHVRTREMYATDLSVLKYIGMVILGGCRNEFESGKNDE